MLTIKYHDEKNCPEEKAELGSGGRRGFLTELCKVKAVRANVFTNSGKMKTNRYRVRPEEEDVKLSIEKRENKWTIVQLPYGFE